VACRTGVSGLDWRVLQDRKIQWCIITAGCNETVVCESMKDANLAIGVCESRGIRDVYFFLV
jgi:hypothetical protein